MTQTVSATLPDLHSPHGGDTSARADLYHRFANRIAVNPEFNRGVVSYQDNKKTAGLRWFKYKEAFSSQLVRILLDKIEAVQILDPFAGIGTTPLTASGMGRQGTGMELMPVGLLAAESISVAAKGLQQSKLEARGQELLRHISKSKKTPSGHEFRHVPITLGAFPRPTEVEIARANAFLATQVEPTTSQLLRLACMSVLEEVSFTRKDGQYLRWDRRSGRKVRSQMEKGPLPSLHSALERRIHEMVGDLDAVTALFGGGQSTFTGGSCLEKLRELPSARFDAVITSPPYANRYDYSRTYALELAYLGFDQDGFRRLRQTLLSATVENHSKLDWLSSLYGDSDLLRKALAVYDGLHALHEPISILHRHREELGNPHVIRLVRNYFLESAVVIAELGRVVRPGGAVFMVNDNVQYHGEEIPVDLILSAFAEEFGFRCRHIWTLARGKGNASQQMGLFGRREIRKCVYYWERIHV